jgi:hypothetical protein
MVKVRLSFLIILIGLLSLPGMIWSAVDEQSIAMDQQTNAIKVLAFGRPVLPTGAGPIETNGLTADIIEPALDPRGDIGIGSVSVSPVTPLGLLGDFNSDGFVNAADFVVWRKSDGQPINLPNSNNDGVNNAADYNDWRANFGKSNS